MFRSTMCVVALACVCFPAAFAGGYGAPPAAPSYGAPAAPSYAAPQVVHLPGNAEAQAQALTEAAGAKASAAKINAVNWDALNRYGLEIGVPLLVKPYGELTGLYAAALPPRSFVGKIDPVFVKDSYGHIKYISGSSIGAAVI